MERFLFTGFFLGAAPFFLQKLFSKKLQMGSTGVEPATPGLKVRCSVQAELRAHNTDAEEEIYKG